GFERAEAVRQMLGQHRNHVAGEVHRVATRLRFAIERAVHRHIVRYVGNGDVERIALATTAFAEHGVVEVLGVFAIDGDEGEVAQVDALGEVVTIDAFGEVPGFFQYFRRPLVRDVVHAQR